MFLFSLGNGGLFEGLDVVVMWWSCGVALSILFWVCGFTTVLGGKSMGNAATFGSVTKALVEVSILTAPVHPFPCQYRPSHLWTLTSGPPVYYKSAVLDATPLRPCKKPTYPHPYSPWQAFQLICHPSATNLDWDCYGLLYPV